MALFFSSELNARLNGPEMKACDSAYNWASGIMTCFPTTATKAVNFPHTVENICILLSWLRSSLFCAEEASASTKRTLSPLFILKVCIFIGETLLFLNWAITADILMVSADNLFLRRASVEIPPSCQSAREIAVVQFSREVSESSLKYSGCCGAAANRRSFSPNVDSRAGGRRGDVSLTSVQVSETFHNEDVARAKSNETLCEAADRQRVSASEALHTAAAGRGALQNCRRDCESRARRSE